MARPSKEQRLSEIHDEAMREFDAIQSAVAEIRQECLDDRRFCDLAGAQWEGRLGEQFANRLRFEFNKVSQAIQRIENDYLNNRITVDFISREGDEHDELADACDDLYRSDEQDSNAAEAYDNAFGEGVRGGMGAFRLRNCYEDEEDEDNDKQRIRIEPIFDADSSVFFDLNAKRQDKSDATKCFVLTGITADAYEDTYGEPPSGIQKEVSGTEFDWFGADVVFIAEYYRVETTSERILTFTALTGDEEKYSESDFDDEGELLETLTATGWRQTSERKIKRKKVHKYIIDGARVIEDCGFVAGRHIPIVPYYGRRLFIDNIERPIGHVRAVKDAQRLKNMQLSKLGEMAAMSPLSKPIFAPEQMAGVSQMWADDPVENYAYLLANPLRNPDNSIIATGPSNYTKAPEIPPAVAALIQITDADMREMLGNQQGTDKIVSNISGDAVEMIQQRLDMQSFIYMSNFAKAIRRAGEIWLSMAAEVYVEKGRKLKGMKPNGTVGKIELMQPYVDDDGEVEFKNDLSKARFDVAVDVGPTSDSARQATIRSITGMMQMVQDPETMQVLSATALMNMKGEGISDLNDFFRQKLVRMGAVKPTDEEAARMQEEAANRPPDPQQEYLKAAAEQANAEGTKARATTIKVIADAEKTRAQTAEILANMDAKEREELMALADKMAGGARG